jgi:hypothetical protein
MIEGTMITIFAILPEYLGNHPWPLLIVGLAAYVYFMQSVAK